MTALEDRLDREIHERRRAQAINQTLFNISTAVMAAGNLDALYPAIQQSLGRIIDVTNFTIAIYNRHQDRIVFPYFVDEKDDTFPEIHDIANSQTLTAAVIRSGEPLKFSREEIYVQARKYNREPVGTVCEAWLGVPLKTQDQVIGAIVVQNYADPAHYDRTAIDLLCSVSNQVAVAIERKRTEQALKESQERYRKLSEVTTEGLLFHHNGRIVDLNAVLCQISGYQREDLLGQDLLTKFVPPAYRETALAMVTAGNKQPFEIEVFRKNGALLPVEIKSRRTRYRNQRLWVVSVRDITHRKEVEKRLLRSQKLEAIGTLAGGIAHDFNNILSAIMGYAEIGRIHDGREGEQAKLPIHMAPLVKETLKFLHASLPINITIRKSIALDTGMLLADGTQIHQVLMNLCTNAAQAMKPDGGVLDISLDN